MESGAVMKYFKNMKGKWLLIIALLAGVALIIFGNVFSDSGAKEKDDKSRGNDTGTDISYTEQYRKSLEESVKALCAQIKGTSNVNVLLTLEAGSEYVYAQNSDVGSANNQSSEYVISSADGSPNGLLIKENYPKICGIAVVCTGGDNTAVKKEIIDLLSAAFNLSSNRIYVAGGK